MKTLIIYTSQTGFTKKYADWLAQKTGGDLLDLKDAQKKNCSKICHLKNGMNIFPVKINQP